MSIDDYIFNESNGDLTCSLPSISIASVIVAPDRYVGHSCYKILSGSTKKSINGGLWRVPSDNAPISCLGRSRWMECGAKLTNSMEGQAEKPD